MFSSFTCLSLRYHGYGCLYWCISFCLSICFYVCLPLCSACMSVCFYYCCPRAIDWANVSIVLDVYFKVNVNRTSTSPCLQTSVGYLRKGLHKGICYVSSSSYSRRVCLPDSLDLDRSLSILFWLSACE